MTPGEICDSRSLLVNHCQQQQFFSELLSPDHIRYISNFWITRAAGIAR